MKVLGVVLSLLAFVQCQWQICDVLTDCPYTSPTCDKNPDNMKAECILVEVPLDWNNPDNNNLQIFVKRIFPKDQTETQYDLWMLMGGPGFSGSALDSYAVSVISEMNRKITVYIPDQRGVGRSSYLDVPSDCGQLPLGECVRIVYGEELSYFTVTQTAQDIIYLIQKFSLEHSRFIYGWSYGTYLLNRILQISPDIGSKYVFEGLCPPGVCTWDIFDINTNNVASAVLTLCAIQSSTCRKYLGPFPTEIAGLLFSEINSGTLLCLEKLNKTLTMDFLRMFMGNSLTFRNGRILLSAIMKRLFYCKPSDIVELNYLLNLSPINKQMRMNLMDVPEDHFLGFVLSNNIIISELLSPIPTSKLNLTQLTNQVLQQEKALVASLGAGQSPFSLLQSGPWPIYPTDKYYNGFAQFDKPYLLLNGELDPQTSHAFLSVAAKNFPQQNQHVVSVPYGIHQTSAPEDNSIPCPLHIISSFLTSNTSMPDTHCLDEILPPDFEGTSQESQSLSMFLFGTTNLWGSE